MSAENPGPDPSTEAATGKKADVNRPVKGAESSGGGALMRVRLLYDVCRSKVHTREVYS